MSLLTVKSGYLLFCWTQSREQLYLMNEWAAFSCAQWCTAVMFWCPDVVMHDANDETMPVQKIATYQALVQHMRISWMFLKLCNMLELTWIW